MMEQTKQLKISAIVLSLFLIVLTAAGCSNSASDKEEETKESTGVLYTVSVNGVEVRVGETKVQSLLDSGLKVTVSDASEGITNIKTYEIDPDTVLAPNTYYTAASIWITDHIFAHISMVTDEVKETRMGDCTIARLEFSLSGTDEKVDLDRIVFDGTPLSELSRAKAGEQFPDFTGDEVMWFSPATMDDYEYFMSFDLQSGKITKLSLEYDYDVDWTGSNQ